MKKNTLLSTILTVTLGVINLNTNAADYTVQVGAYKEDISKSIKQAQKHGEVFQKTQNNLTKVMIGRFATKAQAKQKRDNLKNIGFHDAFITTLSNIPNYSDIQTQTLSKTLTKESKKRKQAEKQQRRPQINTNLNSLTPDELSKASYLDGRLRILSNGKFLTVEEYRRAN